MYTESTCYAVGVVDNNDSLNFECYLSKRVVADHCRTGEIGGRCTSTDKKSWNGGYKLVVFEF